MLDGGQAAGSCCETGAGGGITQTDALSTDPDGRATGRDRGDQKQAGQPGAGRRGARGQCEDAGDTSQQLRPDQQHQRAAGSTTSLELLLQWKEMQPKQTPTGNSSPCFRIKPRGTLKHWQVCKSLSSFKKRASPVRVRRSVNCRKWWDSCWQQPVFISSVFCATCCLFQVKIHSRVVLNAKWSHSILLLTRVSASDLVWSRSHVCTFD